MTKVKMQLQSIAKNLAALSKKVESLSAQLAKTAPAKKAKAAPKKAKKVKTVKKAAPAKKAKTAKKTAAKKVKVDKGATVLNAVSGVINKSKKGISIAQLKNKTKLNPRQLSNALYKLTKKGAIKSISRGVYIKA
jgi:predicted Rossmann fold nucleotide-binding protein DprA/Smf involved in DNA uptake